MGIGKIETLTRNKNQTTNAGGDHERFAHYVYNPNPGSANVDVTKAIINGTPLQALCGKKWVPSRDPKKYPLCPECKEIRDRAIRKE